MGLFRVHTILNIAFSCLCLSQGEESGRVSVGWEFNATQQNPKQTSVTFALHLYEITVHFGQLPSKGCPNTAFQAAPLPCTELLNNTHTHTRTPIHPYGGDGDSTVEDGGTMCTMDTLQHLVAKVPGARLEATNRALHQHTNDGGTACPHTANKKQRKKFHVEIEAGRYLA